MKSDASLKAVAQVAFTGFPFESCCRHQRLTVNLYIWGCVNRNLVTCDWKEKYSGNIGKRITQQLSHIGCKEPWTKAQRTKRTAGERGQMAGTQASMCQAHQRRTEITSLLSVMAPANYFIQPGFGTLAKDGLKKKKLSVVWTAV